MMEELLIFLIVLIFILQGIARLIQKARPQAKLEPEEALPPEVEEYLKSIELPPEEVKPSPPELTPGKKAVGPPKEINKYEAVTPTKEIKEKEPEITRALPSEKIPLFPLIFSAETIKQGIILSTILGPPKARRFQR